MHIPRIPRQDPPEPQARRASRNPWQRPSGPSGTAAPREPAIMMPASVVVMLAILALVQVARGQLGWQEDITVLGWFAFIPARYADMFDMFPGGVAADVWTFVTYALLHGSWMHLITNGVWLVAFGSAVARRFGALRFWVFSAVAAAGGAGLHLALHFGEAVPVVGASAAIAGLMAAAARFVFDGGGPMAMSRGGNDAFRRPALSLRRTLQNRSALFFILIFFGINLLTGVGGSMAGGLSIAWEAHVGGFLVGLLLFRYFDPVPR